MKLYGTADSSLVAAAFKHGESMKPYDVSDINKLRIENMEIFSAGVKTIFDKLYADNKNTMNLISDNAEKALDIMEAGGAPNDWSLEMHSDVVSDYKERLKAINAEYGMGKGGDLERSKLRAEMNRYMSNIQNSSEMFRNMTMNAANSRLLNDLGSEKTKLYNMILEDHNNGTSLTKPTYENGDLVYTLPGTDVKMTMREISEGMSAHDPKYLAGIQKQLTDFQAQGKTRGKPLTAEDARRFKNRLQSSITNWDEIRNASQEKFGNMEFSFEEVLTGQAKDANGNIDTSALETIYDELDALGSIDIDNDGDIDEDDKSILTEARNTGTVYTNPENGYTLIDALRKDKQKYRDVLANYLTETAVKDFYGRGVEESKRGRTGSRISGSKDDSKDKLDFYSKGKGVQLLNNQYLSGGAAESLYSNIQNGLAFDAKDPITKEINRYSYHVVDGSGGWYQNYQEGDTPETKESYIGSTGGDMAKVFTTDSRFLKLKTAFKETVDLEGEGTREDIATKNNKAIFKALDVRSSLTGTRKDDKAAKNLNEAFNLNDRSKVMFVPYSGDALDIAVFGVGTNIFNADAPGTNDIMLYDPINKKVVTDANGDVIRFPTGDDAFVRGEGLNPTADKIIKILEEKFGIKYGKTQMTAEDYINEGS